ncbi:uncharacterized protein LOC121735952 [Aricia agestis]|uniref:uncharacterized protein LOC121735952 n=1 Tax=Aricia agestis TaxID=91739 RepID=UPI001C204343|nr:uncharacterized protein LOC121735952 [Aricia agestis]
MYKFFKVFLYSSAISILLLLDYIKEIGVVELLKKYCCRTVCSVVKTIKASEIDLDFPLLLREGTFMVVVMMIIRALTKVRGKDKIDKLLQNSEAVKEADYFLDKWRMRKGNNKSKNSSYLADERIEVPILHMAFVEATSDRNQFERGDAADTIYMSDTTVLSMSSLFDDDLSTFSDEKDINFEERRLWDFTEENFG